MSRYRRSLRLRGARYGFSRSQNSFHKPFAEIAKSLEKRDHQAVFDGEVVAGTMQATPFGWFLHRKGKWSKGRPGHKRAAKAVARGARVCQSHFSWNSDCVEKTYLELKLKADKQWKAVPRRFPLDWRRTTYDIH
jgi:hypothetical protein